MNPQTCVRCKGLRKTCGADFCPLLAKSELYKKMEVKKNIDGQSPGVFVGSYGYPKVFVGPMTTPFQASENIDNTETWYGMPLEKFVNFRSQLYRAKDAIRVDSALDPNKDLQLVQEVAMAKKAINSFVEFKRTPKIETKFSIFNAPYGPSGYQKKFEVNENISVKKNVDAIVTDDLVSTDQMFAMYDSGIGIDQIIKILSIGLLGFKKRIVPTKWSITATDDTLAKRMLPEIRNFDSISEYLVFESNYLDNHIQVLLIPGNWSYEQVEFYKPGTVWTQQAHETVYSIDYETYKGRKRYAQNCVGGYYAARLGICEYLMKKKRQATCFVLREIGEGYVIPVGVWEVRENARYAMQQKPVKFDNLKDSLEFIGTRFRDKRNWEQKSELLKIVRSKELLKKFIC